VPASALRLFLHRLTEMSQGNAVKVLKPLPKKARSRVMARIQALKDDLAGDVKKLTDYTPEYRLEEGMLKLHPEILKKNGKSEFVVLPYEEFLALQERLADAEDLLELRKAKRVEAKKKSIPLAEVKRELGIR
jgi:hypothetical protein